MVAAPRKYHEELRERAVRMAVDARRDPVTRPGVLQRVGEQLGINPETLVVSSGHRNSGWFADASRVVKRAAGG